MSRDDEYECPHDETDGEGTCLDCGKFLSWRDNKPRTCDRCGDTPCQGCQPCCGSKLGRDPEDGSCMGCG